MFLLLSSFLKSQTVSFELIQPLINLFFYPLLSDNFQPWLYRWNVLLKAQIMTGHVSLFAKLKNHQGPTFDASGMFQVYSQVTSSLIQIPPEVLQEFCQHATNKKSHK